MKEKIKFTLNGKSVEIETDTSQKLLGFLRTELELTGTKFGCGIGFCGSCTIVIDGTAVRSCGMLVKEVEGTEVITIEGLSDGENLHPLQKSFLKHDAQQCGFCTSGMIMNAYELLTINPNPTVNDIIDGMNNNLCRCGSYNRITKAIQTAAKEMNGGDKL